MIIAKIKIIRHRKTKKMPKWNSIKITMTNGKQLTLVDSMIERIIAYHTEDKFGTVTDKFIDLVCDNRTNE